jgi:hypothetical protein
MQSVTGSLAAGVVLLCLMFPSASMASEKDRAEQLCKDKIRDTYGLSTLRNVWGEKVGNHKYKIHGQARIDHHKYPFDCKIKNGQVKSYAYSGPNPRHRDHDKDDDSDSGLGTVLAVGAGLAIVAALAASQDGDDDSGKSSDLPVKESALEDDCHDALQYRIRDEHNYTARVKMEEAEIEGHDLVGNAKVKYDGRHPNHATFTCHFDNRGRLMDSRYHLY